MRIALVVPRWSPTVVGGAEQLARFYAAALAADHTVEILTTCARDHVTWANELPAGETAESGLTVRRFPTDPADRELYANLQLRLARGETLAAEEERQWQANGVTSRALLDHLRDHPYELVVGMPYFFGVVQQALAAAGPRAVLVPCLHPEPQARLALVRELFAGAGAVFFNSPEERALAAELHPMPPARPVIGMGLDSDPLAGGSAPVGGRYLLYLGRKEEGKGTHLLAAYFQRYCERFPETELQLVYSGGGELPRWPPLAGRLRETAWLEEADKHALLAGALALAQPSAYESLSIVTLEAWRCRRPVLVNFNSAVQRGNVMRSGGGLGFEDEATFCRSLRWLEKHPAGAAEFGRRGNAHLRRHYAPRVVGDRLRAAVTALAS